MSYILERLDQVGKVKFQRVFFIYFQQFGVVSVLIINMQIVIMVPNLLCHITFLDLLKFSDYILMVNVHASTMHAVSTLT